MTWGILLVCLLIHALICLGIYLCRRAEILKFSSQAFPLVALVPVWGLLAAATAEWNTRRHKSGAKLIDLEDLHINDYRLLGIEEESTQMPVVPLEEAFLINDAATRRRLMVEILRQDPNQYIQLLQQARLNDDIEVTHYASTAMMEVQREYEIDLQRCERRLAEEPDSARALDNCLLALRRYIDSGLLEDSVLGVQRTRYGELLDKKRAGGGEPDRRVWFAAAENRLALRQFGLAAELIDDCLRQWPQDENSWLLQLQYGFLTGDGALIRRTTEEIQRREIYLSAVGREALRFWGAPEKREVPET